MAISKCLMRFVKPHRLAFIIFAALSCSLPFFVFSKDKPTLNDLFTEFFRTDDAPFLEFLSSGEIRENFPIRKLWDALGLTQEDICWVEQASEGCLFGGETIAPRFDTVRFPGKINLRYRLYFVPNLKAGEDGLALLRLSSDKGSSREQWLVFKKLNSDWVYRGSVIVDGGTEAGSLLDVEDQFFIKGRSGDDEGWIDFYRLTDDKPKYVSDIRESMGEAHGYKTKIKFCTKFWPGSYLYKDIGLGEIYIFSFYGQKEIKGETAQIYLFSFQKNVVFMWDADKNQYVFDPKRSQVTEKELGALLEPNAALPWVTGGPTYKNEDEQRKAIKAEEYKRDEDFYTLYKNEIENLKINGNKNQKEWVADFERHLKEDKIRRTNNDRFSSPEHNLEGKDQETQSLP